MGCDTVSPVIAVKCADEVSTIAMWNALLQAGVYVNIALPPGTPNKLCLLRCSVSAAHSFDDIDKIIAPVWQSCGEQGCGLANRTLAQHCRKQQQPGEDGVLSLPFGENYLFPRMPLDFPDDVIGTALECESGLDEPQD